MRSKKYVYLGIAGAAIAIAILMITQFNIMPISNVDNTQKSSNVAFLDFSYDEANSDIRSALLTHHINMTKPIRLGSASDVRQYCNFLTDPSKQALVTYCTSTELKDNLGFLGNVNMLGNTDVPGIVVVALQTDPFWKNYADVKTVFGVVLNSTICDCWDKDHPGGYQSLSSLMDNIQQSHLQTKEVTTSTHVFAMGNKHFKVELTTNEQGYLWKLLVSK